jgi:hypothetical protein
MDAQLPAPTENRLPSRMMFHPSSGRTVSSQWVPSNPTDLKRPTCCALIDSDLSIASIRDSCDCYEQKKEADVTKHPLGYLTTSAYRQRASAAGGLPFI